jgi:putative ABC transport system permease protein
MPGGAQSSAIEKLCRAYGLMMRVYPRSFREQFGQEMLLAFRSQAYQTSMSEGRWGLFILVLRTSWDWVVTLGREHCDTLINIAVTALRNMVANRLLSAINISGLAIGFAAAILIALFVRDEFSYDKWIPGHERSFAVRMLVSGVGTPGGWSTTTSDLADILKAYFPAIEDTARLRVDSGSLRHGQIEANETIYWADPDFFQVVPLPAAAGNLKTALLRPDAIVITRRIAQKYFGRANPIGETLVLNRTHLMQITAVLEDLPSNTHLNTEIILSNNASFSLLAAVTADHRGTHDAVFNVRAVYTYMRLKKDASIADMRRAIPKFIEKQTTTYINGQHRRIEPVFVPLASVHLNNIGDSPMRPPGDMTTIVAMTGIGVLIVLIAAINFVNLMTSGLSRRTIEIGVRKLSGASRRDIAIQFIGESLIYVLASTILALALVELLLPIFDAWLNRGITLSRLRDTGLLVGIVASAILTGILAALYPGFVLSAFRPVSVLRRDILSTLSVGPLRGTLVVLQFAVLIGLTVATSVVYRQSVYALNEGVRLNTDRVVLIQTACRSAFKQEVQRLPGVTGAACSALVPVKHESFTNITPPKGGAPVASAGDQVDFGFFELYGVKPLAGRLFSQSHSSDSAANVQPDAQPSIIINETAVRRFGFYSPAAAVGRTLSFQRFIAATGKLTPALPAQIIGVVPDFTTGSVNEPTLPTIFDVDPTLFTTMSVRLKSGDMPETLTAIDRLWEGVGPPRPIMRQFFQDQLQGVYANMNRTIQVLGALALVANFIACLGLFGLAAAITKRRTKEIGIRKAMGAGTSDILYMLAWQFSKPVLWANVIAWPLAWLAMRHWLNGFAYHVDLSLWQFVAAGILALTVALFTVASQAFLVARQRPVLALRHESQ